MHSDTVTRSLKRALRRGLLHATRAFRCGGVFGEAFAGLCPGYIDLLSGHVLLHEFGHVAPAAAHEAGGVPFVVKTIARRYPMVSRSPSPLTAIGCSP